MKIDIRMLIALLMTAPVTLLASLADRKIEETARASYNYRTVLAQRVSIESRDGVVTLTGTVEDKDDKALAAATVENLPGVAQINNDVVVKSSLPAFSDEWIAMKVRGRLLVKANVNAATTNVRVKDGIVTLTGTALDVAQKDLTALYAQEVEHVSLVQNDIMVITPTGRTDSLTEVIDDASITSQVRYALLTHHSTRGIETTIMTKDGAIVVTGEAASEAEKAFVSKLAEGVRGVKSVTNHMTVKE
jgi:osmotically-inducible protein OsmY